jgi:serine-type D-Ala-D-Ala carboxypeptidase (penicillin-binding protein 5/6)
MRPWVFAGLLGLAAVAYLMLALLRTLPAAALVPVPLPATFPGPPPALAWPAQGQAAAGVEGVGLIGTHGSARPTPIASLAKVMTAYLVLRAHPLASGASGPLITVRPADVAVYRADLAAGQSVVLVQAGERLTERQALEALLLPSGNNIATLLAKWEAGSEAAFVAVMNAQARALGLAHTHYADASGVRAATASTAGDQLRLAMLALKDPVFAQIVAMPQVTLPVAGRQYNVNALLGRNGIVGVKTGSTSQAGGCFLFAAHDRLARRTVTLVGAVLHQLATRAQPSIIDAAFDASRTLLASVRRVVRTLPVVRRGGTVAWVRTPWADRLALRASGSASLLGWPGLPISTRIATAGHIDAPLRAGQRIGTAVIAAGEQGVRVELVTSGALQQASLGWRLTDP